MPEFLIETVGNGGYSRDVRKGRWNHSFWNIGDVLYFCDMDVIALSLLENIPVEYQDIIFVAETKVCIFEKIDGVDVFGFGGCRVNVR